MPATVHRGTNLGPQIHRGTSDQTQAQFTCARSALCQSSANTARCLMALQLWTLLFRVCSMESPSPQFSYFIASMLSKIARAYCHVRRDGSSTTLKRRKIEAGVRPIARISDASPIPARKTERRWNWGKLTNLRVCFGCTGIGLNFTSG